MSRAPARPLARVCRRLALVVLGVCLVELGLQAASAVLAWKEARGVAAGNWRRAGVRILCLGESTTAPNDHAWPRQLQRLLDERFGSGRYAVINAAHGSTTSGILLSRLPGLLDRYQPQLVIAMMGVNDSRWFGVYEENALSESRWRRWAARLKLPKLAEYAYYELRRGREAGAADDSRRLMQEADEAHSQGRPSEARTIYRRIFDEGGATPDALAAGVRLANDLPAADAAGIYARLAAMEASEDHASASGGFAPIQWDEPDGKPAPVTAENYRKLVELLRSRGVRLAAMQYPTLPLKSLEELTPFPPGTLFIDNEDNFRNALKRRRYDDLFADRFRTNWGHCTAEGDLLIAEGVLSRLQDAGLASK